MKQKRRAAESDDESSSEEESDEEGEDESDDDEQYTARFLRLAVIKRKGKGKTLRYLVDWETELDQDGNVTQTWDPTWERPVAEDISDDLIDDFEAERTYALV